MAKISTTLAFLAIYICVNLLKVAHIFPEFEHLNDFQTISYGGHFLFQNEVKIFHI